MSVQVKLKECMKKEYDGYIAGAEGKHISKPLNYIEILYVRKSNIKFVTTFCQIW